MDPSISNVRYLLSEYARILDELRKTPVVRSKNNPLADYAEWLVCEALGCTRCPKSTKGHDATKGSIRYEIKARRITSDNKSRQLSSIRGIQDKHFDYLVGVLFKADFEVDRAALIPWSVIEAHSKHNQHQNSAIFHLRNSVWELDDVVDVTAQIQKVEAKL